MSLRLANFVTIRLLQDNFPLLLVPQCRERHTKHWDPKWKSLRRQKVMKVDLPKFREKPEDLTEDQMRAKLKEHGLLPPRPWVEKPFFISSTGGIFEPYVPPEGDGKISPIHMQGAKQKLQFLEKKSKTMMAIRKIRMFEEEFDTTAFCKEAEEIYVKMHELMAKKDWENITDYVTERAYPEVIHNVENKTIHWKFIKNIELPRVVHARCTDVITKENVFGQTTVRFHTQQMLAVYDRFGRLMHGSEIIAKDVLEYIVFEKHLANVYGKWRIQGKIIPDWLPPKQPSETTYIKPVEETPPTLPAEVPPEEKEISKESSP
ncbi:probable 39S ribosomal protein L45, mitochondrial [Tribolium madens]|uniref:probable 39S ribosomal protein L45, mitochondrial n=1 Tax=Tribolium madens TaxID=41895 RepID=UPI001CF7592F|nr:probable 39S ribosomal protein L45, mitochondrial [Tribolium madens]